ncbi:hypothetical protein EYF80_038662 [Liparis tanakae]|uniref:Uncharacterized protein n=1 Tax=Liparis tanakae TaxID=230148 RepID=A0A4Z2GD54_9TELE|nr:hypothetical protein EYF80_038662 [Liparis tanakae]
MEPNVQILIKIKYHKSEFWKSPHTATLTDRLTLMPETDAFDGLVAMVKNSSTKLTQHGKV